MGRIVISEFVSIDGVMEAPGGEPGYRHTGWVERFQDEEQVQYKFEEVQSSSALLIGRVTYESFAGAWPNYQGEFADRMNAMPKYVASTTLTDPAWNNTRVLQGPLADAVGALKREVEGDILVNGSRRLARSLREHGLVDEYRLMVFPIVLGSGDRLFAATSEAEELELAGSRAFGNGVVELTYRVRTAG